MSMKTLHNLPEDNALRLDYLRNKTYFDGLGSDEIDCLSSSAYFIYDKNDADDEVSVITIDYNVHDKEPKKAHSPYILNWVFEGKAADNSCSLEFLFDLNYKSDVIYGWRKGAWFYNVGQIEQMDELHRVLGRWLFPDDTHSIETMPNLLLRIQGKWKGWANTDSVDVNDERHSYFAKNDAKEDEAYEIYKKIVHPLKPMPVVPVLQIA